MIKYALLCALMLSIPSACVPPPQDGTTPSQQSGGDDDWEGDPAGEPVGEEAPTGSDEDLLFAEPSSAGARSFEGAAPRGLGELVGAWWDATAAHTEHAYDQQGNFVDQHGIAFGNSFTLDSKGRFVHAVLIEAKGAIANCRMFFYGQGRATLRGDVLRLADTRRTITMRSIGTPGCQREHDGSPTDPEVNEYRVRIEGDQLRLESQSDANLLYEYRREH